MPPLKRLASGGFLLLYSFDLSATIRLMKPILRGYSHLVACLLSVAAGILLTSKLAGATRLAALVYCLGLSGLFAVSAIYHIPQWSPVARKWMRRLDHSFIFILIAATATPIGFVALPSPDNGKFLWLMWGAAGLGLCQSVLWVSAPKWLAAMLYIAMGWLAAPYLPELLRSLGLTNVSLILVGGLIYSLGAIVYAIKKPNPFPQVFGYHEIFHLLVIVGALLHFLVIHSILLS